MNKNVIATIVVSAMLPLSAYVGAADSIGNGISDIVGGVGSAVTDVGKGVGNGVSDVGNGIGNAFSSGNANKSTIASDSDLTNSVNNKIKDLTDTNQIAPGNNIVVKTTNGVVVISGVVVNSADIDTIKKTIMGINGVKNVNTVDLIVK